MQNDQPSLFARDDTFFGVCQGLGEDFGFNPVWLRMALPVLLYFFPIATLAAYAGAGVVVFATRWIYPEPRLAADVLASAEAESADAEDWVRLAA